MCVEVPFQMFLMHCTFLHACVDNLLSSSIRMWLLSLGGVDDVGQLCARLQSSHRLDPAPGEVGENGRPEQVIFIFLFSPPCSTAHSHSHPLFNCSLR